MKKPALEIRGLFRVFFMNDDNELVEKKARQLFSGEELPQAMALLTDYGTESWERETARVRMAMLKLSGGKLELLRRCLKTAHTDYRDILAGAEYPNEMRRDSWKLPAKERAELARQDRQQYLDWLREEK